MSLRNILNEKSVMVRDEKSNFVHIDRHAIKVREYYRSRLMLQSGHQTVKIGAQCIRTNVVQHYLDISSIGRSRHVVTAVSRQRDEHAALLFARTTDSEREG